VTYLTIPDRWFFGVTVWEVGSTGDLDRAWREIFGVSRLQAEREVGRWDGGEMGTVVIYESGRMARLHEYGGAEIRI